MITKIILEGPNNVGKSYLAKKLYDYTNCQIEHLSEKSPNTYTFYYNLLHTSEPLIFDRFALSEFVYSEIEHRNSEIDIENLYTLLNNKNVLVIYVDADYDFISNSCASKNEVFDYETIFKEKQLFNDLYYTLKHKGINIIKVKNHVKPYFNVFELIMNILQEER